MADEMTRRRLAMATILQDAGGAAVQNEMMAPERGFQRLGKALAAPTWMDDRYLGGSPYQYPPSPGSQISKTGLGVIQLLQLLHLAGKPPPANNHLFPQSNARNLQSLDGLRQGDKTIYWNDADA